MESICTNKWHRQALVQPQSMCMSMNMSSALSLSSHFHIRILPSCPSIPSRLRPAALRLLRSTPTGLSLSLHNSERRSSLRTLTIAASGSSPSPAPKMVKAIRVYELGGPEARSERTPIFIFLIPSFSSSFVVLFLSSEPYAPSRL